MFFLMFSLHLPNCKEVWEQRVTHWRDGMRINNISFFFSLLPGFAVVFSLMKIIIS